MSDGKPVPGSVYIYAPNNGAPIFFTLAFTISGLFHLWQCYHYKCFKLTSYYPFCALLFVAGFALREYGAFHYGDLNVYIASTILIYTSPPILELANYHILGRLLYHVPYFAPMHPGRVLTTFGILSSVVEVLNGIGISYTANTSLPQRFQDLGHALLKASLVMQILVISLFYFIAGIFHLRCKRFNIKNPPKAVQGGLRSLYVSMALIFMRTIYRTVEHFGIAAINVGPGFDLMDLSPVLRYEWFFYVFEATLMLVNSALWNMRHPRRYLPESYRVYLAQDGKTEVTGPGWKDNRTYVETFVDPFGCFERGKGKERPFWEGNGYENSNNQV